MKFQFAVLSLAVLVTSCGPSKPKPGQTQYLAEPPENFPVVSGQAGPDDIALFLAGKPVRRGATLSRYQQTAEYQLHQREMRAVWTQLGSRRYNRMRSWANAEVSPNVAGQGVLLYPFGGPDLLYANAMFPNIPAYALMGLEPVGEMPPLESMSVDDAVGSLAAFRNATKTQLQVGYFITKDMRSDLERSALRGVTPILLSTISLTGGRVDSVAGFSAGGKPGVEIRFRDAGGAPHRAMYVSGDLSNGGFSGGYRDWISGLGRGVTYFKAASYLMHDDGFSNARKFFLAQSNAILQDDSGIPFRYFEPGQWSIRYHGFYQQPIELFAKHGQADLRAAYAPNPRTPLPFGSGYAYDPDQANLIFAVRR